MSDIEMVPFGDIPHLPFVGDIEHPFGNIEMPPFTGEIGTGP